MASSRTFILFSVLIALLCSGCVLGVRSVNSKSEFDNLIRSKTAIVFFRTDWAPPCKLIAPAFAMLANEYCSEEFVAIEVDLDRSTDIASANRIGQLPTFRAYKDGEIVGEVIGANYSNLRELFRKTAQ